LQDDVPDLLILDFELKEPDVYELLSKIKALAPKAVSLIILEKPAFTTLAKLIDLEISGIIEKPFDKESLNKEISRLV
jgi:DNA-binding NtrC family response regulator